MTAMRHIFTVLIATFAAAGLSGCGAASKLADAASLPHEEVKKLEEEVNLLHETIELAKLDAEGVGEMPKDVDPSTINPSKLKKAMEDCFAEPIREVKATVEKGKKKGVQAAAGKVSKDQAKAEGDATVKKGKKVYGKFKDCMARRKEKAGELKEMAPGGKTDFVKSKLAAADHLRKNLHFLTQQSKAIPGLLKELATAKAKAVAADKAAQNNPLLGAGEKKKNAGEFKKMDDKIDRLISILKKDAANLPGDLVEIGKKSKSGISGFAGR